MHLLRRFNVRVYGILMNENSEVLVADELIKGRYVTKFPGGGLELGEGTRAGLQREFKEELNIDTQIGEHFYTTDFYVPSDFDTESQVISIYYMVNTPNWKAINASPNKFNFKPVDGMDAESFRWVHVDELNKEEHIVLPIDKIVTQMLIEAFPKVGFKINNGHL
jgi:8-oxo-dGTP diphosphatase